MSEWRSLKLRAASLTKQKGSAERLSPTTFGEKVAGLENEGRSIEVIFANETHLGSKGDHHEGQESDKDDGEGEGEEAKGQQAS